MSPDMFGVDGTEYRDSPARGSIIKGRNKDVEAPITVNGSETPPGTTIGSRAYTTTPDAQEHHGRASSYAVSHIPSIFRSDAARISQLVARWTRARYGEPFLQHCRVWPDTCLSTYRSEVCCQPQVCGKVLLGAVCLGVANCCLCVVQTSGIMKEVICPFLVYPWDDASSARHFRCTIPY